MLELRQETLDKFFYDSFTQQEVSVQDLIEFTEKYSIPITVPVNRLILEAIETEVPRVSARKPQLSTSVGRKKNPRVTERHNSIITFLSTCRNKEASKQEIIEHFQDNGSRIADSELKYARICLKGIIESTEAGPNAKWRLI